MGRQSPIHRLLLGAAVAALTTAMPVRAQNQEDSPSEGLIADEPITDEEFHLPVDPTAAASADELIPKLGSPLYKQREDATAGLIEIGAPTFQKLRSTYHDTDDLEVQLRIERIVRTAYLDYHVYNRSGFLGINLQPYVASMEEHPRLPSGAVGVKVGRVIPGTAAERAGLKVDDVIFEVDGEPVRGEGMQVIETFSATIRARGPGGKMKLTILRGLQQIPVDVTIGRCPEEIARQGTVRTVSENHYKASARFPRWWDEFFLQADEANPSGSSRASSGSRSGDSP